MDLISENSTTSMLSSLNLIMIMIKKERSNIMKCCDEIK